jgi:hypothetical protein
MSLDSSHTVLGKGSGQGGPRAVTTTGRVDVTVVVAGSPADPEAERAGQGARVALGRPGLSHEVLFTGSPRDPGRALVQVTLAARGDVVVWMDASSPAWAIPDLVYALATADQAVAVPSVAPREAPRSRRSWRRFVELLCGSTVPDPDSGFRAFRRAAGARYLHLLPQDRPGYATMTAAMLARGHEVAFVPVSAYAGPPVRRGRLREAIRMAFLVNPARTLGTAAVAVAMLCVPGLVAPGPAGLSVLIPLAASLQLAGVAVFLDGAMRVASREHVAPEATGVPARKAGRWVPFHPFARWGPLVSPETTPDPDLPAVIDPARSPARWSQN